MSLHLPLRAAAIDPHSASGPHELDPAKVADYAAAMKRGEVFPPIRAVDYGDSVMIVDGHHRVAAARLAGSEVRALLASGEQFEDLDIALRDAGEGSRADDGEFWT